MELAGSIHAALEALDAGQEDVAETEIRRLLQAEPQARLARSLLRQIKEDPLTVIGQGRESFTHRVQPGETLAKIAARYFNDQHLFYALARLNNIKAPKSLAAGQVIRVPGRATAVSTPAASPSTPVVPVPASAVEPATPQPTAAQQKALIDKHAKAARTACIRQDLDTCIAQWAEVLKIEPNHPTALLEQPRAMRLRDKLRGITK